MMLPVGFLLKDLVGVDAAQVESVAVHLLNTSNAWTSTGGATTGRNVGGGGERVLPGGRPGMMMRLHAPSGGKTSGKASTSPAEYIPAPTHPCRRWYGW